MKIYVGIPARLGSTRFPNKPLCKILNFSMIQHCVLRSRLSKIANDVIVCGCDKEVEDEVDKINGKFIMTDKNVPRPALRVAEGFKKLNLNDEDIVVVVQGDEPLVHPDMIDLAIQPLLDTSQNIYVSNLCSKIDEIDWKDPLEIKVVTDLNKNAIYMSRSPIPSVEHQEQKANWYKQVCIMPFKWHFMKKFLFDMPSTPLEKQESIEMLRIIENGYKVRMVENLFVNKSVDNENDRKKAEELMLKDEVYKLYKDKSFD